MYQTFTNLYILGSSFVRNELMHTDIRTGKSRSLRAHRTEEPPIDMIRVSHLKQVLIFRIKHATVLYQCAFQIFEFIHNLLICISVFHRRIYWCTI